MHAAKWAAPAELHKLGVVDAQHGVPAPVVANGTIQAGKQVAGVHSNVVGHGGGHMGCVHALQVVLRAGEVTQEAHWCSR